MKKGILLGLPLMLIAPLMLLMLGMGSANIEAVRVACASSLTSGGAGGVGLGTLNWRGASHYEKNPHPGERPYAERVPNMVSKIGASGASIIGFQEFEPPQAQAFLETTNGAWAIVAGQAHGSRATANSIAYQPAVWQVDEVRYVSIEYGGGIVQIPLVRFTSRGGLGSIWVLNTHNPANAVGGTNASRDSAVRAEAEALRQLQAAEPNTPLFLAGDMNDRARFKQLFVSLAGSGWSSANPSDNQIDWVMGGPGVSFSGTVVDHSTNDNAHQYTDHPFVYTTAQLTGSAGQAGTGTDRGGAPADIEATVGGPVSTQIPVANANTPRGRFTSSVRPLTSSSPEVATLNESGESPTSPTSINDSGPSASATPGTSTGTTPPGCPPCPSTNTPSVVLPNATGTGSLRDAKIAAAAAYQAGFRGEDLVTAVAIARVESTWNPRASNGTHFGLWQIAESHKGKVPGWNAPDDIYDPLLNAQYAYALYQARPGSGEAKFADWIPFEKEDYRTYLDAARQAVAATAGGVTNAADTGCAASPIQVAGELSAALSARVDAMMKTSIGLCGLSWTRGAPCTYDNQCPKVVDALYGGPGVGRGYGPGKDVAQGIINAGLAQAHGTGLDPLPPVGAVVSYNTGNGVGHVAIYVGGGKIFGNDYGCSANGVYGCVGFADVHTPGGSVTWALPDQAFDLGGMPAAAA